MDLREKLSILAASARYDASCASSGTERRGGGRGRTGMAAPAGVCHSWTGDGRCVSLLKVLYSNACRFDCAYCANRSSADIRRAAFTPAELARLTISFYKRNYIEGLFLSSGIFSDPDIVMDKLTETARLLRTECGFDGYIHLKAIPGAGEAALSRAARWADRLSANIELPTESSLRCLAPQKEGRSILSTMRFVRDGILERKATQAVRRSPALASSLPFAPAGQSTQLVIGASPEADGTILKLADSLYRCMNLRRVYYSAYVPVRTDERLPLSAPPLRREHRLYQADWLLRFYGFSIDEVCAPGANLALDYDPKVAWALAHPEFFPVELERADYEAILRVPGIGVMGARRVLEARRAGNLGPAGVVRLGVAMKRAKHFITIGGRRIQDAIDPGEGRLSILLKDTSAVGPGEAGSETAGEDGVCAAGPREANAENQIEFIFEE
jgi:putative DNA modification/repair radical SAM protein